MDSYVKRSGRALLMPFSMLYNRFRVARQMAKNPSSLMNKASTDVVNQVRRLGEAPQSISEYKGLGEVYVAKKLLFVLILAAILLPAVVINFLFPVVQSRFLTKTMPVDSVQAREYTGKVRLTDRNTGTVLFKGRLEEGRINGDGTLWNYDGTKIYAGGFQLEMYSGHGEEYYATGQVKYRGEFDLNRYEGKGILYYEDGTVWYDGTFAGGQYDGQGTLYYPDGGIQYQGMFAAGLYEGDGILCYQNKATQYSGAFSKGLYEGTGTLYDSSGAKVYEGGFSGGIYDGSGTLYQNGVPVYVGEFQTGKM